MKSDIDMLIGARISKRREECGVSALHLSAALGSSVALVLDYEAGRRRISACELFKVSRALDIGVSYFFQDLIVDVPPRL